VRSDLVEDLTVVLGDQGEVCPPAETFMIDETPANVLKLLSRS